MSKSMELAARATALQDAIERLRELRSAPGLESSQVVAQLHAWLESQVRRYKRRLAAVRPGRKVDQWAKLERYREPGPVGRPRSDGARDRDVHARVTQWLKANRSTNPSKAQAFAAVAKQLTNRRKGEAPTPSTIKAAFYRHERRSETPGN